MYSLLLSRPFKKTFLILVVALSTIIIIFPCTLFAYHGQEISISLNSAQFIPLNAEENQVNVFVNYTVNDSSLAQPEDKFSYESI